ncbi:hypothetical protein RN607_09710 [Demequina capsici]|uniref:Lipoprotein n=1 Tax=Demequina capsici TaxID=3075620 RepID=A0AA96J9J8_9MICO|nr:DUF6318 family protein [Demequina sp. PMTSA13]WNM26475.1 hypothetical protein RN607_09710 [Demequina sp. PMTSA13]
MTGAKRTLLPIALAGALAMTGCTGDDGIVTEAPFPTTAAETTAASASPSPSATALTDDELLAMMPPDAARDDLAGAIATIPVFFDAYVDMLMTSNSQTWDSLSAAECEFCQGARADLAAYRDDGYLLTDGSIRAGTTAATGAIDGDGTAIVSMPLSQSAFTYTRNDGGSMNSAAGEFSATLQLSWTGRHWRVEHVEIAEQ